jgi:hypothetical protein
LREDGILQVEIKEGIEFTKADADALLAQKVSWTKERLHLLIDLRKLHSTVTDVFLEGFADVIKELRVVAYVVESTVGQQLAEIEIGVLFDLLPAKIFFPLSRPRNG